MSESSKTMLDEWKQRQRRRQEIKPPSTLREVEEALEDYRSLIEVEELPESFRVSRRRYLSHEEFSDIHQIIKRLGGRYLPEKREWLIPRAEKQGDESEEAKTEGARFEMVPIDALTPPERSLRFSEDEELEELVESVKRHGILQPILARPRGILYEVVAGERRLKAAKKAGLIEVPVIIREMSDEEVALARLIENIQRRDLSAYEKARELKRFLDRGYTQKELAEKLGKKQPWVAKQLRALRLEGRIPMGILINLSERQVRAILKQPEEIWEELGERIEKHRRETGEMPTAARIEEMAREIMVERMRPVEAMLAERLAEEEIKAQMREMEAAPKPPVSRETMGAPEAELAEEVTVQEAIRPVKPIQRFIQELYELFPDAGDDYIIDRIVEEYGVSEEEALRELSRYKAEAEEEAKPLGYWVCNLCGAWTPGDSISPIPEEMKRHINQVHGWKPDPAGGTYWEVLSFGSEPGEEGRRLDQLELTKGYWICNLCKAWHPGYDLMPPEPMKHHLLEEHDWRPPSPGAWGEALTFSEIAPGEGRRLDKEPKERKLGEFVADFKCPICGYRAVIIHIDSETHKLQRVREP